MNPDRRKLIRLAYQNPDLRPALMPLLKEAAGREVHLDVVDFSGVGTEYVVMDSGVRSDHSGLTEFLHEVESEDGSEGHIIVPSNAFRRGQKLVVTKMFDRPRGDDYAGAVKVHLR